MPVRFSSTVKAGRDWTMCCQQACQTLGENSACMVWRCWIELSCEPHHPLGMTLRPRTVSNSLTAGTSIAITVKP